MADYSWVMVGGHRFLPAGYSYFPEVAALFAESERQSCLHAADGESAISCGYLTTAHVLLERLHALGITSGRAAADLDTALDTLAEQPPSDRLPHPVPGRADFLDELRAILATDGSSWGHEEFFDRWPKLSMVIDGLSWHMEIRNLVRVLLECSPAQALAGLDLSELDREGISVDPHQPLASQARSEQLAEVAQNAPLLVLTEGSTDADLLELGMRVTHPHLVGFVNFMNFRLAPAERNVGALVKTVDAFIVAGVANRFVAIADNDTAGHDGLANLTARKHPSSCRVLHYPPLEFLAAYPAVDPDTGVLTPTDVNGAAGSLEMYFGQDVLTRADGTLMPVHWGGMVTRLGRRQGALSGADKKAAQKRFRRKAAAAQAGNSADDEDWNGIRAIIDSIIHAFD
ncbi:hypothetical protein ACIQPQ_17255 [Streptomyces sp. NPDC091281]|uniref:hypothetical protein n=1 Tax=Streptomyces sp. NPDC091281 TaxID=3365985 RepID=UPI0038016A7F